MSAGRIRWENAARALAVAVAIIAAIAALPTLLSPGAQPPPADVGIATVPPPEIAPPPAAPIAPVPPPQRKQEVRADRIQPERKRKSHGERPSRARRERPSRERPTRAEEADPPTTADVAPAAVTMPPAPPPRRHDNFGFER